jgi:ribosomal protein L7Ae-like RNA K-turn-binding protein
MDCESLSAVPSVATCNIIRTPIADQLSQEIFITRFQTEIIKRFHFTASSQVVISDGMTIEKIKRLRAILASRIIVGVNKCTDALHDALQRQENSIALVVVCNVPKLLSHVPMYAQSMNIPVLLLPEHACSELGCMLGIKSASMLVFRQRPANIGDCEDANEIHDAMDSLIVFVRETMHRS